MVNGFGHRSNHHRGLSTPFILSPASSADNGRILNDADQFNGGVEMARSLGYLGRDVDFTFPPLLGFRESFLPFEPSLGDGRAANRQRPSYPPVDFAMSDYSWAEFQQSVQQKMKAVGESDDPFDYLRKQLEAVAELKWFGSYTLFVRDSITGELRLEKMRGVQYEEPLRGFIMPVEMEAELLRGMQNDAGVPDGPQILSAEDFFPDAVSSQAKVVAPRPIHSAYENRIRHLVDDRGCRFFGNFIEREGVRSCARFRKVDGARVQMVLFVNFNQPVEFDSELRQILRDVFHNLSDHWREIADPSRPKHPRQFEKWASTSARALKQIARILQPIGSLAALDDRNALKQFATDTARRRRFFREILGAALAAMQIPHDRGFGTIHLFHNDARRGTLNLAAQTFQDSKERQSQNVYEGEGVISWVAMKRKPLLISDLPNSEFRNIHIDYDDVLDRRGEPIRSLVAVPMLAGGQLVGVLNLESLDADAFTENDVHTLVYAAAQAAIALRFSQRVEREVTTSERVRTLLEVSHKAVAEYQRDEQLLSDHLDRLAGLMTDWLKSDRCELFTYDDVYQRFNQAGASYDGFSEQDKPRSAGWSKVVLQIRSPIWVTRKARPDGAGHVSWWKSTEWHDDPPEDIPHVHLPHDFNPKAFDDDIESQLGLPMMLHEECIGVAWLKRRQSDLKYPTLDEMREAYALTGQIALVIKLVEQFGHRQSDANQRQKIQKSLYGSDTVEMPTMQGYILTDPSKSDLGGDFHAVKEFDNDTAGILIGDATGHGLSAAFHMLPLITIFRAFSDDARSPSYLMEKLYHGADIAAAKATALYFVLNRQRNNTRPNGHRYWLRAVAAGHPSLLIRHIDRSWASLPREGNPAQSFPLYVRNQNPSEDSLDVNPGDLIIGCTDGVTEAHPPGDNLNLFGNERIRETVDQVADQSPREIAEALHRAVREHNQAPLGDDLTILVLRVTA